MVDMVSSYEQPGPAPETGYRDMLTHTDPDHAAPTAEGLTAEQRRGMLADQAYDRAVAQDAARSRLREERALAAFQEPKVYANLVDMRTALWTEDEDPMIIGGGLVGVGDLVSITGQAKQGKTTAVLNLALCLSDGRPFLGHEVFSVTEHYRVCVYDGEMPPAQWMRKLYRLDPQRPELIQCIPFRGYKLDLTTDLGVDYAVRRNRRFGTHVWIVDNFSKFSHSIESEHDSQEVNRYYNNLQSVMEQCPDMLAVINVHHAGHSGGRSRGSSVHRDRPDVLWDMRKSDPPEFLVVGRHGRAFTFTTVYDDDTGALGYPESDVGSPTDQRSRSFRERILAAVLAEPGVSVRNLIRQVGNAYGKEIRAELAELAAAGIIRGVEGPRRSKLVYPGAVSGATVDE